MKYKRLTKKGGLDFTDKNLTLKDEMGYSYIYNRLAELEDKIENGTLIEVPCKVGDFIYWRNGAICGGEVSQLQLDIGDEKEEDNMGYVYVDCGEYTEELLVREFGKSWFLSREDLLKAEARLKELKESK